MYTAKAGGKDALEFFEPRCTPRRSRRLELGAGSTARCTRASSRAVPAGRRPRDRQWSAWRRSCGGSTPTRGSLPPAEFIPIAEETGVIVALGRWVLERGVPHAAGWRPCGRLIHVVASMSSARQLARARLRRRRSNVSSRTSGLPPDRLVLEITESALLDEGAVDDRCHREPQGARRPHRARRLRNRLLVPQPPASVPDRHPEDRSQLRRRHRRRQPDERALVRSIIDWRSRSTSRRSPRASSAPSSSIACGCSARTSGRASCSGSRWIERQSSRSSAKHPAWRASVAAPPRAPGESMG